MSVLPSLLLLLSRSSPALSLHWHSGQSDIPGSRSAGPRFPPRYSQQFLVPVNAPALGFPWMLLLDAGDELDGRVLKVPGVAGCSGYSDALDALDQGITQYRHALDALHSGYSRRWRCSASQDIPDARAALYPGYPGRWGCSGLQDSPDAPAPRSSAVSPQLPAELSPRGPRAPPCPALLLLQLEPSGAAEQPQARTGMLPAKPARQEEDPECGRDLCRGRGASSPQGGRCEWVCAGASPTFTCCCGCTQRMQKRRSRRWGWGGEEEMK